MIKVNQTEFTDLKKGQIGNCLQACICSLFELSLNEVEKHTNMGLYLPFIKDRFGLTALPVKGYPPCDNNFYIVSYKVVGIDADDICHCVIWKNGRIVHDPRKPRVRLYRACSYVNFFKATQ